MSFTPIPSAAAGIQAPNVWSQIAEAIGQYPEMQAQAQERKTKQAESKLKLDNAERESAQNQLSAAIQQMQAKPDLASNPAMMKRVSALYQKINPGGVDPFKDNAVAGTSFQASPDTSGPTAPAKPGASAVIPGTKSAPSMMGQSGTVNPVSNVPNFSGFTPSKAGTGQMVDVNQLMPRKDFSSLSISDITALSALPPEQRAPLLAAYNNVPPGFAEGKQVIKPSAGEITAVVQTFQGLPAMLSSGGITFDGAMASISGSYDMLKAAGMNPDAMIARLTPALTQKAIADLAEKVQKGQLTYEQAVTEREKRIPLIQSIKDGNSLKEAQAGLAQIDMQTRGESNRASIGKLTAETSRLYAQGRMEDAHAREYLSSAAGGGKRGGATAQQYQKDLEHEADKAQARVDKYESAKNSWLQSAITAGSDTDQGKEFHKKAEEADKAMKATQKLADSLRLKSTEALGTVSAQVGKTGTADPTTGGFDHRKAVKTQQSTVTGKFRYMMPNGQWYDESGKPMPTQ